MTVAAYGVGLANEALGYPRTTWAALTLAAGFLGPIVPVLLAALGGRLMQLPQAWRRTAFVGIPAAHLLLLVTATAALNHQIPNAYATTEVPYRLVVSGWQATLRIGKSTLLFEVIAGDPASVSTTHGKFNIPVTARASGCSTQISAGPTIKTEESSGQCIVSLNSHSFTLSENGSSIVFPDHTYALDVEQTIVVAKDGTTNVADDR